MPLAVGQSAPTFSQPAPAQSPLTSEHITALNTAKLRSKKIRRAANVALFSGCTLAFFAFITLLGALFGDVVSLILGVALSISAYCELHGGAMLRRFDPKGAHWLGWNQLGLALLIFLYALWSLYSSLNSSALASVGGPTGDAQIDDMVSRLKFLVTWGAYGGLAIFGLLGPGLTAWYYFSRAKLVRELLTTTPDWVIQALRAAG